MLADALIEMKRHLHGATMKHVNRREFLATTIPLPPLAEQKRIAGILDAADALRAKRRESLAQLDVLLQSTFLDMFGDPGLNSKSLPTATLGELGDWHSGGTPPRKRKEYFAGTIPWFSSGELEEMYISESAERITESAIQETSAKPVPAGSLMLGMYDTAALKAAFAAVDSSCNQAIAFSLLRRELCNPVFVYLAIIIGREHFRRLQRGVRQKNLNLSMVRQIRIPLPSLELQHRFADIVESVEQQKASHRSHLDELETLFASLQSRAFQGDL
jgi:type I restriction enzyme S subunit